MPVYPSTAVKKAITRYKKACMEYASLGSKHLTEQAAIKKELKDAETSLYNAIHRSVEYRTNTKPTVEKRIANLKTKQI